MLYTIHMHRWSYLYTLDRIGQAWEDNAIRIHADAQKDIAQAIRITSR